MDLAGLVGYYGFVNTTAQDLRRPSGARTRNACCLTCGDGDPPSSFLPTSPQALAHFRTEMTPGV